jgi:cytochrome c5
MNKKLFILLILFLTGCLQQAEQPQQTAEPVSQTIVPKKEVPVPYTEESKSLSNPIMRTEGSIAIGKKKYDTFCSMCHGATGKGGENVTRGFDVDPSSLVTDIVKKRSDGELFWATSNGVNGTTMLSWNHILSDEEIWHIVNYMRLLQKKS